MGAFLQSYAQYRDVRDLNQEKILDFASARRQFGAITSNLERSATFHIFWSPGGGSGRLPPHLGDKIVIIKGIVSVIIECGYILYMCLDMAAIKELERKHSTNEMTAMIEELRDFGALVENTDAFWTRTELQVMWDPIKGTACTKSQTDHINDLSGSLDASTSSEEPFMIHFDPRSMTIPKELIPLCNLYDRHMLRQKVVINLSVPILEQKKIKSSGGNKVVQEVDQLSLWYLTYRAQGAKEGQAPVECP
jgi:hypothetical protein